VSIASDILALGTTALLGFNGEPVVFRGGNVTAIVDRTVPPEIVQRAELDLIQSEASEVWVQKRDVYGAPRIGEYFTDSIGLIHTIRAVRRDAVFWKMICEVNEKQ